MHPVSKRQKAKRRMSPKNAIVVVDEKKNLCEIKLGCRRLLLFWKRRKPGKHSLEEGGSFPFFSFDERLAGESSLRRRRSFTFLFINSPWRCKNESTRQLQDRLFRHNHTLVKIYKRLVPSTAKQILDTINWNTTILSASMEGKIHYLFLWQDV